MCSNVCVCVLIILVYLCFFKTGKLAWNRFQKENSIQSRILKQKKKITDCIDWVKIERKKIFLFIFLPQFLPISPFNRNGQWNMSRIISSVTSCQNIRVRKKRKIKIYPCSFFTQMIEWPLLVYMNDIVVNDGGGGT